MRTVALSLLALTAVALPAPLTAQTIQINKDNRTVAITATDQSETLADIAAVSVGFEIFGSDQAQTYADASRISNAVADALKKAGIPADAIESTNQNLNVIGEEDKVRYAKGIRFRFNQSWQVTVPADSAANTLHAAIQAGANDSGNIQWKLKNPEAAEAAAATKALAHAHQIAERMVQGLGVKLGPLVYASNQGPQARPIFANSAMAMARAPKEAPKPLAISPEKIETSATIYAVFSIE